VQSVKPIEINFPFLIKNPKKIYEGAKKLGVKINRKNKIHNADYKVKITEKTYHLFLNDKGELWRNPKEKYCYKMLAGSGRHKIVEFFITSKLYDYYPAQEIANNLKDGNTKALIKEIGVINSLVKKKIQIRCKILDSQPPAEYRINPRVSIAATKK
jgi:hypothetical protein